MLYESANFVPEITDYQIEEMLAIMKPAIFVDKSWLTEIDVSGVHPRNSSYIWETKPIGEEFLADPLDSLTIPTFHSYGAPSFFKPSLAETLGCIRLYCKEWRLVKYFAIHSDLDYRNVFGRYHQTKCLLMGKTMVV